MAGLKVREPEIGVFSLGAAGLIWWIYQGLIGVDSFRDKLGMAGVKILFWIIFMFLVLGPISTKQLISAQLLPCVGAVASFVLLVAGAIAHKVWTRRIGQERRLAGVPTKPALPSPWIPAVLTGFVSMVDAVKVGMLLFVVNPPAASTLGDSAQDQDHLG